MHLTMTWLLNITRSRNKCWTALTHAPIDMQHYNHVDAILCVPLTYIRAIGKWPATALLGELSASPPEFLSLMCCLTLEQQRESDLNVLLTSQQSRPPTPRRSSTLHNRNLNTTIAWMGEALVQFVCTLHEARIDDVMHIFATPAVVQFFKRLIIILGSKRTAPTAGSEEREAVEVLRIALLHSRHRHGHTTASGPPNNGSASRAETAHDNGAQLLPLFTPGVAVSDLQLLRLMFSSVPPQPQLVGQHYELVVALVHAWGNGPVPTPLLTERELVRGVYLTAHHCCLENLAWLQKLRAFEWQRHILQEMQLAGEEVPAGLDTAVIRKRPHAAELQQLLALALSNPTLRKCLREVQLSTQGGYVRHNTIG